MMAQMQTFLNMHLGPNYRAAIEQRTYLSVASGEDFVGRPDVLVARPPTVREASVAYEVPQSGVPLTVEVPMPEEITERFIEVRDALSGEVITAIEMLSPTNKTTTQGRKKYQAKRAKVLGSATHLVEIDLLRTGRPFPVRYLAGERESDYRILVSRAYQRPHSDVYLFGIREPIPNVPVPLDQADPDVILPLNRLLHDLYDQARYVMAVNYSIPPEPPLNKEDSDWAAMCVQSHLQSHS